MEYNIKLQGTCWLVQYLNFIGEPYNRKKVVEFLAINRYLRYKKVISLIKNKELINNSRYILNNLMSFEGNLFDIDDILNYTVLGNIKTNLDENNIFIYNEMVFMLVLEMWDNEHLDNTKKIFQIFNKMFGNISIKKNNKKLNVNVIAQDKRFKIGKYDIKNSNILYNKCKSIIIKSSVIDIIDKEISIGNKILSCIDIGKCIFNNNYIILPHNVSIETLNLFLNIENHYYIVEDKINIKGDIFYSAFSGYENENNKVFISEKYLKIFIDHILCDKIFIDDVAGEIDIIKLMECE